MGARYDLLKVVTITGTICSIYNAFTEKILPEDFVIVFLISIALVQTAKEINKSKKSQYAAAPEEKGKIVEETLKKNSCGMKSDCRNSLNDATVLFI